MGPAAPQAVSILPGRGCAPPFAIRTLSSPTSFGRCHPTVCQAGRARETRVLDEAATARYSPRDEKGAQAAPVPRWFGRHLLRSVNDVVPARQTSSIELQT